MGGRAGSSRTPEQTATAQFFASAGPQQYLDSIRDQPVVVDGAAARARYFALVHMALSDAAVAVFDAKYAYNFWRPVTAIRNADLDGNDATARDAGWLSLIDAPMHPEYPCAHCISGAAYAVVVAAFAGEGDRARPLILRAATSAGAAGPRQYAQPAALTADVVDARVWSGVHYRTSGETGGEMGRRLGEYLLATQLRPLPAAR